MGFDYESLVKRQEYLESLEKDCYLPDTYLVARLDGKGFSKYTAKMQKPFSSVFTHAMDATCVSLLEEFRPMIVFTQSDEITMVFSPKWDDYGRRKQKLLSLLAASSSAYFNEHFMIKQPTVARFDCRIMPMAKIDDVSGNLIYRQQDGVRNSISMAAHHLLSFINFHGVGQKEKLKILAENGHDWHTTINDRNKYGCFFYRAEKLVELSPERLASIPEKHRPTGPILTNVTEIKVLELPKDIALVNEFLSDK